MKSPNSILNNREICPCDNGKFIRTKSSQSIENLPSTYPTIFIISNSFHPTKRETTTIFCGFL